MIPKIIFQTWKSKTEIPDNFAHWSKSFRELNPTYAYRLWDDADNRAFIADYFPWFLERYDAYPAEIYRADAVRYFFLYQFGGIYADMDTECLKPLDDIIEGGDVILGSMGADRSFEHSVPNAVMASKARQEFWLLVISMISDMVGERPEYVTGPVVLKMAYEAYHHQYREDWVQLRIAAIRTKMGDRSQASEEQTGVKLATGNVFFPLDWNDRIHDNFFRRPMIRNQQILDRESVLALFPNSLTVSYFVHSWENQNLGEPTQQPTDKQ